MTKRTKAEHEAEAMLLGMEYDHTDHTYNSSDPQSSRSYDYVVYPEDMARVDYDEYLEQGYYRRRREMVKAGEIGCAKE